MKSKSEPQTELDSTTGGILDATPNQPELTLYKVADTEIRKAIEAYLKLTKATNGLANVSLADIEDERARTILMAGLAVRGEMSAQTAIEEWKRRQAIPFELETAIAAGVYKDIRNTGARFLDFLEEDVPPIVES